MKPDLLGVAVPVFNDLAVPDAKRIECEAVVGLCIVLGVRSLLLEKEDYQVPFGDHVGRRILHLRTDIVSCWGRQGFKKFDQTFPAALDPRVVFDEIGRDVLLNEVRISRFEHKPVEVRYNFFVQGNSGQIALCEDGGPGQQHNRARKLS